MHPDGNLGLKIKGRGDGEIVLGNSVGQELKIKVEEGKIVADRSAAGYREFHEAFMTDNYSVASARRLVDGEWDMELIFDVSLLELFGDGGREAITMVVYPDTPYDRVTWQGNLSVELYEIDA